MPIEKIWPIHVELDRRGHCKLKKWLKTSVSTRALARLEATLDHLRDAPKDQWDRPHASPLGSNCYVIRFKDENRAQLRIFGYFHPQYDYFVASFYGSEKDGNYEPSNYSQQISKARAAQSSSILCRFAYPINRFQNIADLPEFNQECLSCV